MGHATNRAARSGGAPELIAATIASVSVVLLHVGFARHAGALWRDEASTVAMATRFPLSKIGALLRFDSSPVLMTLMLRLWSSGPWGASDPSLRALGLIVGVANLLALWIVSRWLGARTPWLALALFGFNAAMIRGADVMRPYGLGTMAAVMTFGLVWRLIENPRLERLIFATLAAVIAVQCLYTNVAILAAVIGAGILIALLDRRVATAARLAVVGMIAALSLAPYAPAIRAARSWGDLTRYEIGFSSIWKPLSDALGSGGPLFVIVWIALALFAAGRTGLLALAELRSKRGERASKESARPSEMNVSGYAIVVLIVSAVGLCASLRTISVIPQSWYFAPFLGVAAVALDAALGAPPRALSRSRLWRTAWSWAPLAAITITAVTTWSAIQSDLEFRQTNVDLIARKLASAAARDDLVIVNPWYFGVSFARYDRGPARWMTIPSLAEKRIHRYDLVKEKMKATRPIDDVIAEIERTLEAGHRVWVVGLALPLDRAGAPLLPPVTRWRPDRIDGRLHVEYLHSWENRAGALLAAHAASVAPVEIPTPDPVSLQENASLSVFSGWVADRAHGPLLP